MTDANRLSDAERAAGVRLLFDGQTLDGWEPTGRPAAWRVEEGTIHCTGAGGGYLCSGDRFGDFELKVEFKIAPRTNSGIFFRWSDLADPVHTGLELQILDTHHKAEVGNKDCGAVYDLVAPRTNAARPAGAWNTVRIRCLDSQVTVNLNGEEVVEMDLDRWTEAGRNPDGRRNKFRYAWASLPREGHIGLQDHGGAVWFRNLKVRPLTDGAGAGEGAR